VDTVSRIVPELILYGRVVRPVLGVNLIPNDRQNAALTRRLGVEGALILEVVPRTGAAEAGLRGARLDRRTGRISGDVIQRIDGKEVTSVGDVRGRLGSYRPGDSVTLTVWRGEETRGEPREPLGETSEVEVRLQAP
jgi:S1-C subfamily serine protease